MLELVNQHFQLDADLMTIPYFKILWDRDETETKEEAFSYIAFVFHFFNPKSPFFAYTESVRKDEIINRLFPPDIQERVRNEVFQDTHLIEAGKIYEEMLGLSPYRSVVDMAKQALQNISNKIKAEDTPVDEKLKYIAKINESIKQLREAETLCAADEKNSKMKGSRIIKKRER